MILPDVQQESSGFPQIPINKVGVRNIEVMLPFKVRGVDNTLVLPVVMSSYCNLVSDIKGINMSRIANTIVTASGEILKENPSLLTTELFFKLIHRLSEAHGTDNIYLKARFKYPLQKSSPVTGLQAPEMVNVELETTLVGDKVTHYLTAESVAMSLCPCSKEMSLLLNNLTEGEREILTKFKEGSEDKETKEFAGLIQKIEMAGFGAHNQKSYIKATVELTEDVLWIEDLTEMITEASSCPAYSILKRPDEKLVTELSYMSAYINEKGDIIEAKGFGPKFVEDIARQLADRLGSRPEKVNDYVVVVENQESIHSNDISAVAVLSAGKNLK